MRICQDITCHSKIGGENQEPADRLSSEVMCLNYYKSLYYFRHRTSTHFLSPHTNCPLKYPDNFSTKSVGRREFEPFSAYFSAFGQQRALDSSDICPVFRS